MSKNGKKRLSSVKKLIRRSNASINQLLSSKEEKSRLIIFDDIFPHLLSAFRVAEFNAYLSQFSRTRVFSTGSAFPLIHEERTFESVLSEYEQIYCQYTGRVHKFNSWQNYSSRVIYSVFLNNAYDFINLAEYYQTPFVFTLYPGGGFGLDSRAVDEKLIRIFSSRSFYKVIVTQKITRDYLLERNLCPVDAMEYIYGGVLPKMDSYPNWPKKYYKSDKDSFDICFVANKYMVQGRDKGYHIFIEVAKKLIKSHSNIKIHVVGSFDSSDIDVTDIKNHIRFYGMRTTSFFPQFYSQMEMIVSPNLPFFLSPNAFDGFPTGSCVEAGLCGVAIFCTDALKQNSMFRKGEEIAIISTDVNEICDLIHHYYVNYDELYKLSHAGRKILSTLFGFNAQLQPRFDLLGKFVK